MRLLSHNALAAKLTHWAKIGKPLTSSGIKRGFFIKQDFIYDAQNNVYICPAGQTLTKGAHRSDRQSDINF